MRPVGPYIVIGVGRSGTSAVARVLHTKLDVFMGLHFTVNEISCPEGTFEDVTFWNMHRHMLNGKLSFLAWHFTVQKLILAREKLGVPWGWKDPVTSPLIGFYISFFEDLPRIIRCNRKKSLVLRSMKKHWKLKDDDALNRYETTSLAMDRILKHLDHLVIDFKDRTLSDDEIIAQIKGKWEVV